MRRIIAIAAVFVLALVTVVPVLASDQWSSLKFTIVKEDGGKPVRNASVVLHPVGKDGHASRGGAELKTNAEGVASVEGIPYGKLRVQVIAHGMQTYGEDFVVTQSQQEIVIKLKPPQAQYSIYK